MACGWQPWLQSPQQVQRVLLVQFHLAWQCRARGILLSGGEVVVAAVVAVAASAVVAAVQIQTVARQTAPLDGVHAAQSAVGVLVGTELELEAVVQCCMCAAVQCCMYVEVQCCVPAAAQCCTYAAARCCTYAVVRCCVHADLVSAAIGTKTHTYNSVNDTKCKS